MEKPHGIRAQSGYTESAWSEVTVEMTKCRAQWGGGGEEPQCVEGHPVVHW